MPHCWQMGVPSIIVEIEDMVDDYILTHSGDRFHYDCVELSCYNIRDIAHALSHVCRFAGHCREFYSVAQHSCIVASVVPEHLRLAALLHDAAEAFIGDMPTPLKRRMPDYRALERDINRAIEDRFDVELHDQVIKAADLQALATERRDLLDRDDGAEWAILRAVEPLGFIIKPISPKQAYEEFLDVYHSVINLPNQREINRNQAEEI